MRDDFNKAPFNKAQIGRKLKTIYNLNTFIERIPTAF